METDKINGVASVANGTSSANGIYVHHRRKKGKRRKDDMFEESQVNKVKVKLARPMKPTKAVPPTTKLSFKNLPNLKVKFVTQSTKTASPSAPSPSSSSPAAAMKVGDLIAAGRSVVKTKFASAEMQSPTKLKLKLSMPNLPPKKETWSSSVNGTHLKIKMNGQHQWHGHHETKCSDTKKKVTLKQYVQPGAVKNENEPPRASQKKKTSRRKQTQFKKVADLDLFCGTRSMFVQVNDDLNECLYCGDEQLLQKFLSPKGLSIQDVKEFLASATDTRRENSASEKAHRETTKLVTGDYSDDDDYAPSIKNKKEATKEKRKEIQQKLLNREYIENSEERNRVFRSHKDNLVSKIKESDKACGTKSFVLILNPDLESATYHGCKEFLAYFFTCGLSAHHLDKKYNIRPHDNDELDPTTCSVPHCVVSRNQLSKWRVAAIELFKFPDNLPMTLYNCPDADRKEWIKRLGLEDSTKARISICSIHFEDGAPTRKNPHPSILLNSSGPEVFQFKGVPRLSKETLEAVTQDLSRDDFPRISYKKLKPQSPLSERSRLNIYKNYKPFRKTQDKFDKPNPSSISKKSVSYWKKLSVRSVARAKQAFRIRCKFCALRFKSVGMYYQHASEVHFKTTHSETKSQPESIHPESKDLPPESSNNLFAPLSPSKSISQKKIMEPKDVKLSLSEFDKYMKMFYPDSKKKKKTTYLCKSCKLKFSAEGFYTHLRTTHKTFFCAFCDQLFKRFGDIEKHLKQVHQENVRYYHSPDLFEEYAGSNYVLTCGVCSLEIYGEDLPSHKCNTIGPKVFECPLCLKTFPKQESLDIHLSNGLCREPVKDEERAIKRFKVLTGKNPQFPLLEERELHEKSPEVPILKPPNGLLKAALSRPAKPKPLRFDVSDKQILSKVKLPQKDENKTGFDSSLWKDLPESGSIFLGVGAQGITSDIRKLYKESVHNWVIPNSQNGREINSNLTEILQAGSNFFLDLKYQKQPPAVQEQPPIKKSTQEVDKLSSPGNMSELKLRLKMPPNKSLSDRIVKPQPTGGISLKISLPPASKLTPPPKKESKNERVARQASKISACLEKMSRLVDSFGANENCLLCQQSKFLTVDTIYLLTHLVVSHDRDDVEKNLEEDPADSILRIRNQLKDLKKEELIFEYVSVTTTETSGLKYNCCFCEKVIDQSYEELFDHLNNEHNSKVLNCCLCQNIFLNYGSFVSHVCFGPSHSNVPIKAKAKFVCPICHDRELSTFLDFQVHVRQTHDVCEICLKSCGNQVDLRSHCLSHSQELMCMKCFVNNEDTNQFRKHLFNFHDNEHSTCTKCHQKTWKFVYHFCIPPESTTCEVCDKSFLDFKHYRVHLRTHTGSNPHVCTARGCKKSYISKQLLLKHQVRRHQELRAYAAKILEDKRTQRQLAKYGAKSLGSLQIVETVIMDLIDEAIKQSESIPNTPDPEEIEKEPEADKNKIPNAEASTFLDPVDAAVRSIMGPEGSFGLDLSPTKDLSSLLHQSPLHHIDPELPLFNSNLAVNASEDFADRSSRSAQQVPEIINDAPTSGDSVLKKIISEGPEKPASTSDITKGENQTPLESPDVSQGTPNNTLASPKEQQVPQTKMSPVGPPRKGCKILKPRIVATSPVKRATPVSMTSPNPDAPQISAASDSTKKPDEASSETASDNKICSITSPVTADSPRESSILPEPSASEVSNIETSSKNQELDINKPSLDKDNPLAETEQASNDISTSEETPTPLSAETVNQPRMLTTFDAKTITEKLESGGWDVLLSENSEDDDLVEELKPKKPRIIEREVVDKRLALKDHDYTYNSYQTSRLPPTPPPQPVPATPMLPPPPASLLLPKLDDLSEMDKIANNVAMGINSDDEIWNKKEGKKKKKKRKKHRKRHRSSSESDGDAPMASSTPSVALSRGPKPKYHTSLTGHGVTAGAARPRFSSSSDSDASSADTLSDQDLATSDYDTDFSADEAPKVSVSATATTLTISTKVSAVTPLIASSKRASKPTAKIAALKLLDQPAFDEPSPKPSPNVTLKIKMPPMLFNGEAGNILRNKSLIKKSAKKKKVKGKKRPLSLNGFAAIGMNGPTAKRQKINGSSSDSDSTEGELRIVDKFESRRFQQTETEKVFCICRGAKDSSASMIGCDGQNCILEWFHFDCVGIKQPPAGKWYCPDCRRRYGYTDSSFLV